MMKDEQTIELLATMNVACPSSMLVIGLGNPILGDDGVGWKIAEEVKQRVETDARFQRSISPKGICRQLHVEVDCLSLGGLSLMERMLGHQRVILVDAMETGQSPAGTVKVFPIASLSDPMSGHSASIHDASLLTALRTAEAMGMPIPKSVEIVAIEAENVYDFTEELSPSVAKAVPLAAQAIMDLLSKEEP